MNFDVPRALRICVGCGETFAPASRNQRACKPSCRVSGRGAPQRPLDALLDQPDRTSCQPGGAQRTDTAGGLTFLGRARSTILHPATGGARDCLSDCRRNSRFF
jgi:hypothetical protein